MNRKGKRILIGVLVAALVCGVAGGGYYLSRPGSQEPVNVYSMDNVGMSGYWGDESESYGPVTTDKVQSVYVSTTQIVNEIFVEEGQEVHVGDPLMSYDTTLSSLQLESKGLEVQKLELSIQKAREELKKIQSYRPGVPVPESDEVSSGSRFSMRGGEQEKQGFLVASIGSVGSKLVTLFRGSEADPSTAETQTEMDRLKQQVQELQEQLQQEKADKESQISALNEEIQRLQEGGADVGELEQLRAQVQQLETDKAKLEESNKSLEESYQKLEESNKSLVESYQKLDEEYKKLETKKPLEQIPDVPEYPLGDPIQGDGTEAMPRVYLWNEEWQLTPAVLKYMLSIETDDTETSDDTEVPGIYVALMVRDGNTLMANGSRTEHLYTYLYEVCLENDWPAIYPQGYLAGAEEDPLTIYNPQEPSTDPVIDEPLDIGSDLPTGVTYTSAEIAKLRSDKELEIKSLEIDLKVAQVEYERLDKELNTGTVYSEIDGVIKIVNDAEMAAVQNEPLITVSGGGGYYVNVTISELDRETVQVGQVVTVRSWESGQELEGTVYSIGDLPSDNGYYSGMGNSNVTYYPFVIFVDEDASLKEGEYVDVRYNADGGEENVNSLYIETMFVRTENGQSYCMVAGEDGTLEKRVISTGKNLWGSYVQVRSGLTMDDQVAFPYGKEVKEGAPTQDGNMEDFYNSMYN